MIAYLRVWRDLLGRCWRLNWSLTLAVLVCNALNTAAFVAVGAALRSTVNSSVRGEVPVILVSAIGAALAYAADWGLTEVAFILRMHLVERVALGSVDVEVLRAAVDVEGLDHLERPEYLDRIMLVRNESWFLVDSAWAALESVTLVLRLGLILVLLGSVNPWLLSLLVFATVPLWLNRYGRAKVTAAQLAVAEPVRLQRHLFDLCTSPVAGKEIRLAGTGEQLVRRQAALWDEAVLTRFRAGIASAVVSAAGWCVFALGFAASMVLIVRRTADGHGSVGDLVFAIVVGSQLRGALESAVHRSVETGNSARLLAPYLWLLDYHAARTAQSGAGLAPPDRLRGGITFENVTFCYPATARSVLDTLNVHLPAGSVVAVVGEYGSGKTTLVKLLAKLYQPQAGRILVEGVDLADIDAAAWRARTAAAFQDFGRYCTTLQHSVGLGEPDRMDDPAAVADAVREADAEALVAQLPDGLSTPLGNEFGGTDLSEGQWQKVALARACMRDSPLLFILDEPTASLDALSEHAVFEHHMRRAGAIAARSGAITIIVSHRFSTVAGADLILVMQGGAIVDSGDHTTLLARGGLYAELFAVHARAYTGGGERPHPPATRTESR
jgi:ATP-binding cassette subfamily B protein